MANKRRRYDDSDEEVEIVATSWDERPSAAASAKRPDYNASSSQSTRYAPPITRGDGHPYSFPTISSTPPVSRPAAVPPTMPSGPSSCSITTPDANSHSYPHIRKSLGSEAPAIRPANPRERRAHPFTSVAGPPTMPSGQHTSQPARPSYSIMAPDANPYSYPPMHSSLASNASTGKPAKPRERQQPIASQPTRSHSYPVAGPDPNAYSYPPMPSSSAPLPPKTPYDAAPPPAKKQRKKKDPNEPVPEKRGAMFKKACPKNIMDRAERVMQQRFFMVDRTRVGQEPREEFKVLGSTGNVYSVIIDKTPSCTCPDATKGNHCKHIIFVYLKVLNVSTASGLWYQKALLTSELQTIFDRAPPAPNSVAHQRIRDAYAKATGKAPATAAKAQAGNGKRRIPGPEDDCAVCYEGMHGLDQKELTWCADCGNPVHNECFTQWAASQRGKSLTCVHCRAKWVLPAAGTASAGGAARSAEGYMNLANVAGIDDVRDTSTYYQGPRRGERHYGYQEYY